MAEEEFKINFEKKQEEPELNISKVVLKTGLVTVFCCLLVIVLAFTITAFVSPKLVSDISLRMGAKGLSARFAVAHYERTKDINDLATAVERSISGKKHKNVVTYGEKLIEFESESKRKVFADFADFKDETLNDYYAEHGMEMVSGYYNFIYGNYVYSLYKVKEKDKAYMIALESMVGYTGSNPMRKYINAYIEDKKRSINGDLSRRLEEMYDGLIDNVNDPDNKDYCLNICADLIKIYEALGEPGNVTNWKSRYDNLSGR